MGDVDDNRDFRVSVVIPAYNAGKYLRRALDSVLAQTRPADEIIVVNDGSTDDTEAVARSYGAQIHYLAQVNAGVSAARNAGIETAKGDWIAFLDADDEWLPRYLECQLGLLARHRMLVWSGTNYYRCLCQEDRRGPDIDPDQARAMLGGADYHERYFQVFSAHATGWTGSLVVKREVLQACGLFRVGLKLGEDVDMWFRIALRWPQIGFVPEPSAVYHMDVADSAIQTHVHAQLEPRCDNLARHLKLAAEHEQQNEFAVAGQHITRSMIRGALFRGAVGDAQEVARRFGDLAGRRWRWTVAAACVCPPLARIVCRGLSCVARSLRLRKTVVRRPILQREAH